MIRAVLLAIFRAGIRAGIVIAAAVGVVAMSGCPGKEPSKKVSGSEGRERWVIVFEGNEPDLGTYHGLLKEGAPERVDGYVEKMRAKLKDTHADAEQQVTALGGNIAEVWWMSNAITVEIEPGKAESLHALVGKLGVKSVAPDTPLGE